MQTTRTSTRKSETKNPLLLQGFEWNLPNDGEHWKHLLFMRTLFQQLGVTMLWIPPAYKGAKGFGLWRDPDGQYVDASHDVGYGAYDLYDLGEFDQNGTIRTKYGTKAELEEAIHFLKEAGIQVIADVVMNHKLGNEEDWEYVQAVDVDPGQRNRITSKPYRIKATTQYDFKPRNNQYSDFKWSWRHFTGTDYDIDHPGDIKIRLFDGKQWNWEVDDEFGNFDYLLGTDIDHHHPEVREELVKWGKWFTDTLKLDGFRLDVVKHINFGFIKHWIEQMRSHTGNHMFTVGEYPTHDVNKLLNYLDKTGYVCQLFDFPLQRIFHEISHHPESDLRQLKGSGLIGRKPTHSVTFVDNHDTQPNQAMPKWVEKWFKLHAYAFTLLRSEGTPSVFWGDLFGIHACHRTNSPAIEGLGLPLMRLMQARMHFAYGKQHDYWVNKQLIAWTREGDLNQKQTGCAALVNTGTHAQLRMYVGRQHAGERWTDWTQEHDYSVIIDPLGFGSFPVKEKSVSVWVPHPWFRNGNRMVEFDHAVDFQIPMEESQHVMVQTTQRTCRILVHEEHFHNHKCFVHFKLFGHDWTPMPAEMIHSHDFPNYLEITLPLYESSGVEFCLTDGQHEWDNHHHQNYRTQRDCVTIDRSGMRVGRPS